MIGHACLRDVELGHASHPISESDTGCVLEVSALLLNSSAVGTKGAFFSEFVS